MPEDTARTREGARSSQERPTLAMPASTRPLGPGDLLSSRFRIVRFIAQGGMGAVFEAEDLRLKERVAIKTLRTDISVDQRERFTREVQLARRVTHPNVCRIFDIYQHTPAPEERPGVPITFLAMELLSGETLDAAVKRKGRLSASEALPIAQQIVAGLSAAHQARVVHRDLKSANIVLTAATPAPGFRTSTPSGSRSSSVASRSSRSGGSSAWPRSPRLWRDRGAQRQRSPRTPWPASVQPSRRCGVGCPRRPGAGCHAGCCTPGWRRSPSSWPGPSCSTRERRAAGPRWDGGRSRCSASGTSRAGRTRRG